MGQVGARPTIPFATGESKGARHQGTHMMGTNQQNERAATPAPVSTIGAPRPGNFWQRWKEWERENRNVQPPVHEQAA
jgi:hypothetical protein